MTDLEKPIPKAPSIIYKRRAITWGPKPTENYEWMKNVFGVRYNRFDKFKSLRQGNELKNEYKCTTEVN